MPCKIGDYRSELNVTPFHASRITAVLVALSCFAPAALADCFDWGAADIRRGAIPYVEGVGTVSYMVGRTYIGYGHYRETVEVRWTDAAGAPRRQRLMDEAVDGETGVMGSGRGVTLQTVTCRWQAESCQSHLTTYVYYPETGRFAGVEDESLESCPPAPPG